ncbi:hypothetical protein DKX38_009311 [Salix brachista]|uniref:Trans-cinnamate 4-monooxygenase n=1 Tax=Salix brachista TaxID=2182728 RepID=A0A5N5MA76_9ROSI|nr:hypothetical protein DKX38_009311 [Salix brachista]
MAHSATKSMIFTLLAVAFVSCMKFACPNYLSTARFSQLPFSLILPLLPLILYFLTSIFVRSSASKNLPPGPVSYPLFGNWLQVGNDLNHRLLASLSQTYGAVFLLKLGSKNLVVVSDPELANQVLHAQGVEFGSRPRNVVFDIFTGGGQDMVFTVYGEHWRKMRRIMTLPFFTNKVVNQYSNSWEQEMDLVVEDLKDNEKVRTEGIVVRKRLQLMLYNIMYRMMFDAKFQSSEDPLFVQATRFNSERSRLAQSFEYNYGDFIPWLRPFLRGYLNKYRDLQQRRLAFFNNYFIEERRKIMASNGEKHKISCAMDHIIHAQMKGEISEENVLYIVENINVAAIETTLWSSASKNLPPGPVSYPLFGNWLQVGNDLNHRLLASLSQTYGAVFLLKLGSKNLVVVSDPELANQVLHAQGVEFGSRPRNVVFDIFTGGGQDMVFTVYGEHWRKMRRIMTLPFFTNKVVNQYSNSWEQEMDLVVEDLKDNEKVRTEGIVVRKRLQLMLYNIMYRMMFDAKFQSSEDPLFVQATRFNSERSRLAQSFEYNYGDFIPWLRPFLRGYLNKYRDLQQRRLAFFNNYFIEERRKIMASNGEKHKISCAMDHIIHAQMKGEISEENVLYIVENINVAAIETTLWSSASKNLPPGPVSYPLFGNWLQVGNDLNHRLLASLSQTYGAVFLLKLGSKNLVVVSDPELANQVLHAQGVEFGSRPRNVVFDIFTGGGQDMVFTVYGEHWRKMRRIMTLPFFTNKVVNQYRYSWEQEMDLVVEDLKDNEKVRTEGIVVRKRLQLMLYNIMYRMMFDAKFQSPEDPLFVQATRFNSERSRLAQSFEYNYGDFIPWLRPFLRGYLNKYRDLQQRRLAFFNNYFIEERRKIMASNGEKHKISCVMDHIIHAQMKGEISEENVLYIVENINVAAIETTLWSSASKNLPPGPVSYPLFGNWLQVGNDLNHRLLASLSQTYGAVFLLKLGSKNLVVVSDPELANQVLHAQGVEFGSRPRNVVFDIFTGGGQDMVFTVYGEHWRKMRRIMTLPFFTNKVVNQYSNSWEQEMDLVVEDLKDNEKVRTEGIVVRKRLQLMLYNIMYRMMFDAKFQSPEDPLFVQATRFNSERSRLAQSFEYNYGDFIPWLRPFLRGYLNKYRDLQQRRLAFFNNYFIEERRKIMASNGEKHKISCAMDHIIHAQMKGEISEENVLYIVENINVAAIETTLWSMEWAIAELVNHPTVQEKIRDEITAVLKGNPVTESSLHELPYLQATIKETLRLHTSIPLRSCPGIILAMPILGLVVARLVSNFEMKAPSVTGKIDVSEKGGQFSLHIANHSTVVFDPIKA